MNTAQLTPRAQAVIADSGETGEPIFRTPCSVGSGEGWRIYSQYADVEIRDADDKLLAVVHAGKDQARIVRAIAQGQAS